VARDMIIRCLNSRNIHGPLREKTSIAAVNCVYTVLHFLYTDLAFSRDFTAIAGIRICFACLCINMQCKLLGGGRWPEEGEDMGRVREPWSLGVHALQFRPSCIY